MRGRWITGFAFTLFFFTAYISSAQLLTTGTITGMLKDGQGGVIPGVVKSLAGRADVTVGSTSTPKSAYWVLTFDSDTLVQADLYPAPPVS